VGEERWKALIGEHVERYDAMQIADLYKLLHQATTGSEHAVSNIAVARQWLDRELEDLSDGPDEPLVDRLGRDGRIVRIHLRPFMAEGGEPEQLLEAFVTTAAESYGGRTALECALATARELAHRDKLPWDAASIDGYLDSRAAEDYPAVHHSPPYVERYQPAYRIIASDLVTEALAQPLP